MIQTEYYLKHKDETCGLMWIDPVTPDTVCRKSVRHSLQIAIK